MTDAFLMETFFRNCECWLAFYFNFYFAVYSRVL